MVGWIKYILNLTHEEKAVCKSYGKVSAAVLHNRIPDRGKTVIVISGGNIDVHTLSIIIERSLIKAGRYVRVKTVIVDKPGALQRLLSIFSQTKANVISVSHD